MLITQTLHRFQFRPIAPLDQSSHLFKESPLDHAIHPLFNPVVESLTTHPDADLQGVIRSLRETVLLLGADLVVAAGLEKGEKSARTRLNAALADGRALDVFARLIRGQGGDSSVCDDPRRLPRPVGRRTVAAAEGGVVTAAATREIGLLAIELGCGRRNKHDVIDPASGFRIHKKPGDVVAKGEPLVTVELGPTAKPNATFEARLHACFTVSPAGTPVTALPLAVERL